MDNLFAILGSLDSSTLIAVIALGLVAYVIRLLFKFIHQTRDRK